MPTVSLDQVNAALATVEDPEIREVAVEGLALGLDAAAGGMVRVRCHGLSFKPENERAWSLNEQIDKIKKQQQE